MDFAEEVCDEVADGGAECAGSAQRCTARNGSVPEQRAGPGSESASTPMAVIDQSSMVSLVG